MVLYPGSSVIASDFKARTVDADGTMKTFHVNPNNFYTGYLAGLFGPELVFPYSEYVKTTFIFVIF